MSLDTIRVNTTTNRFWASARFKYHRQALSLDTRQTNNRKKITMGLDTRRVPLCTDEGSGATRDQQVMSLDTHSKLYTTNLVPVVVYTRYCST